ncbi:hypothetical protein C1646_770684 [Rhizophagus diaphanus]|nr:hypothetical protein C1646_770684 [Rhizophagus diaphanus] [Rhizophagus sp. MUCL 43196]
MAMWKLVNELLSAFEHSDDYNCYQNPLWKAIFLQDVISIQKSNKVGRRKLGITRWKPNDQNSKKKKNQLPSSSNTENSISDQQVQTNLIPQVVIINKDGPLIKKSRKACRETKPEEKSLLEPLVTCSEYHLNDEQIEQVKEVLGNEWDKNQIYQYISCHRFGSKRTSGFSVKNRRSIVEKILSRVKNDYIVA